MDTFVEIHPESAIYENIPRDGTTVIYENVPETQPLLSLEEEEKNDEELYVDMSRDSAYFSALDLNIGNHSYANVGVWQNFSTFPVRRTYPPFVPASQLARRADQPLQLEFLNQNGAEGSGMFPTSLPSVRSVCIYLYIIYRCHLITLPSQNIRKRETIVVFFSYFPNYHC